MGVYLLSSVMFVMYTCSSSDVGSCSLVPRPSFIAVTGWGGGGGVFTLRTRWCTERFTKITTVCDYQESDSMASACAL